MEEKADAADVPSVAGRHQTSDTSPPLARTTPFHSAHAPGVAFLALLFFLSATGIISCAPTTHDTLANVRASGRLVYGSDEEGGGPYIYPDPEKPRQVVGFEVELMNDLARELGVTAQFSQGQWDRLLQNLDAGRCDVVVNGYEWTEERARDYLASRPYYVYQLQLIAPRDSAIRSWDDLKPARPAGRAWKVGVLVGSAADTFAHDQGGDHVTVVRFDGATDAMTATANGQIDATLQDLPAAQFYIGRFPKLRMAGDPVGRGYYVIYARRDDRTLLDLIDRAIARLVDSGELKRLYERYGIWNEAQGELSQWTGEKFQTTGPPPPRGWKLVRHYSGLLLDASFVTIVLSVSSMPLAMLIGLLVALGRLYGPKPLATLLAGYVEVLRGTPLMLQLYVLFYLVRLPPWAAGIAGLAINYSAYEAEIYRAGLQAIPAGQMEAALALGMTRTMALRRVIIPQAVRIVIPPVTNDFIALFKDTSVCSVITLVELTKQYSILANSTGGVLEFAAATAVLYMVMSVPLSWFSRWSERRLDASGSKGGVIQ